MKTRLSFGSWIPAQRGWYHCPHDGFSQTIMFSYTFGRLHPAAQSMLICLINSLFRVKLKRFFCFCFFGNFSSFLSPKHFIKWLLIFYMSNGIGWSLMSSENRNQSLQLQIRHSQRHLFVVENPRWKHSKFYLLFHTSFPVVIVLTVTNNLSFCWNYPES